MAALERRITIATDDGPLQPDTLVLRTSRKATKLTSFGVDDLPVSGAYRRGGDVFGEGRLKVNDVGRKRNLALLLAAGLRWRNALLLDDDMFAVVDGDGEPHDPHPRTLDQDSLRSAVRAVREGGHLAVGWAARGFDDNSVLCRIAAQMGDPQEQFIGGGALLVPVDSRTPFFPSIYNEDWLFLLALRRHRVADHVELLDGGDVHQDEYPAYLASRAAAEELGDVLGEGLASLLHEDGGDEAGSDSFWRKALEKRREFQAELYERVEASDHDLRTEMLKALDMMASVQRQLREGEDFWVSQFLTYSKVWRKDLRDWGRRLHPDDLPKPGRLLASKEFDLARTFGRPERPEDFLRELAGEAAVDARRSVPAPA
jgi:SAM-dependent methyltransferase